MSSLGTDRCWAEVDRSAILHNARVARERMGSATTLLAVVKANAYGHGMVEVAQTLRDEAGLFGVANVHEAQELRASGLEHPIIILGPALPEERHSRHPDARDRCETRDGGDSSRKRMSPAART